MSESLYTIAFKTELAQSISAYKAALSKIHVPSQTQYDQLNNKEKAIHPSLKIYRSKLAVSYNGLKVSIRSKLISRKQVILTSNLLSDDDKNTFVSEVDSLIDTI